MADASKENLTAESLEPNDGEGIKRWLDYLARLKDREDRTDQTTGVTNWILYGVLATLLYKGAPLLPIVASDSAWRHYTAVTLLLMVNFALFTYTAYTEFPGGGRESTAPRFLSEAHQSAMSFGLVLSVSIALVLAFTEFRLWYGDRRLTAPVRVCFLSFGCFHLLFALMFTSFVPLKAFLEKRFAAKLLLIPSSSATARKVWLAIGGLGVFVCVISLRSYVGMLIHTYPSWPSVIKAALCAVIFLWAILKLIARRSIRDISGIVSQLEREILLEDLKPAEIKDRFVHRLAGPPFSAWLSEASRRTSKELEDINALLTAIESDANRIFPQPLGPDKLQQIKELCDRFGAALDRWEGSVPSLTATGGYLKFVRNMIAPGDTRIVVDATLDQTKEAPSVTSRFKTILTRIAEFASDSPRKISEELDELKAFLLSVESLPSLPASDSCSSGNPQNSGDVSARLTAGITHFKNRVQIIVNHASLVVMLYGTSSPEGITARKQLTELEELVSRLKGAVSPLVGDKPEPSAPKTPNTEG